VVGDVDAGNAGYLLSALTQRTGNQSSVCCDLRGVGFFGAAGANVLAVAHVRVAGSCGRFSVRGVRGLTAQVLNATGLDEILTIVP
jgi:anti-anti-sigma factor